MDVTFTNVLEGARQYFQGLPAGTGSTPSPASYIATSENSRVANEPEQNTQNNNPALSASAAYWATQQHEVQRPLSETQRPLQEIQRPLQEIQRPLQEIQRPLQEIQRPLQEIQRPLQEVQRPLQDIQRPPSENQRPPTREHTPVQRPSSHHSDSSRPPSHHSLVGYAPNHEQPRIHTTSSQQPSYQELSHQHQQQSFQFTRPREAPASAAQHQNMQHYQPHIMQTSSYLPSSSPHHLPSSSPHQLPSSSPHQLPSSSPHHLSASSPHHLPSSSPHHLPSSSPHHHPASSPHQHRASSRPNEQTPASSQSYHQLQVSQSYQNYQQTRSFYPVHSQAKTQAAASNNTYKIASSQSYNTTPQESQYKNMQIHTSQSQAAGNVSNLNSSSASHPRTNTNHHLSAYSQPEVKYEHSLPPSQAISQAYKTTHNLPPIASLSSINFHSSRTNRDVQRLNNARSRTMPVSAINNTTTTVSSANSHSIPAPSQPRTNNMSVAQMPSAYSVPSSQHEYNPAMYASQTRSLPSENFHYTTTPTQSYNQTVMTTSTHSSYTAPVHSESSITNNQYYHLNKPQRPSQNPVERNQPSVIASQRTSQPSHLISHVDLTQPENSASISKQKRESPLDLSVKTVRTSADSSDDVDQDVRSKMTNFSMKPQVYPPRNHPSAYDATAFQRNVTQRPQMATATAPKVDFSPDFTLSHSTPALHKTDPRRNMPPAVDKSQIDHRINYEKFNNQSHNPQQQFLPGTSRYPTVSIPAASHVTSYIHSHVTNKMPEGGHRESLPRIDFPGQVHKTPAVYSTPAHDMQRKRPADTAPSIIPNKVVKIDNWKQTIDQEIEQRFSTYKQQQEQKNSVQNKPFAINGYLQRNMEKHPKETYSSSALHRSQQHHSSMPSQQMYTNTSQYYPQASHSQTYVPSVSAHQYSNYAAYAAHPSQHVLPQQPPQQYHHQQLQVQPQHNTYTSQHQQLPRTNSNSSLYSAVGAKTAKNAVGGAANKHVLSLLRNSLEIKGAKEAQRKLEQEQHYKSHENVNQPRSDIQQPSTDVTAPLQPKPGLTGRQNVSPFTPTNLPESNYATPYKLHIPKAVDSVNFETDVKSSSLSEKQLEESQALLAGQTNTSADLDGLAAFLFARIRTKGELKQVGSAQVQYNLSNSNNNNSGGNIINNNFDVPSSASEKTPIKQEDKTEETPNSGSTSSSVSPPKLLKEKQMYSPRRRLFSRNEDDQGSNSSKVPPRDKSGLRSSSETSVFDFPDSDSEGEMPILERQSLEDMRRDRKSNCKSTSVDVKSEEHSRPPSPGDDIFEQACTSFLEELKTSVSKKRMRRKKGMDHDVLAMLEETLTKEKPLDEVKIKTEIEDTEQDNSEIPQIIEVVQVKTEETEVTDDHAEEHKATEDEDSDVPLSHIKNNERVCDESVVTQNQSEETKNSELQERDSGENKDNPVPFEVPKNEMEIKKETEETESPQKDKPATDSNKASIKTAIVQIEPLVIRSAKKPAFGDGSDFYPGWEEEVCKYKKSLRMPPSLIQITRPPQSHRLSTSLPDLDPCPYSPADNADFSKSKFNKVKSEPLDSDAESNSSFNLFSNKNNYDSEGSSSVKSLPNTQRENTSILDTLLQRYGGRKKRKYKKKEEGPKIIPKSESDLLPTPSLEIQTKISNESKKSDAVIASESALLGFRKKTIKTFKETFITQAKKIVGVNEHLATVVLNSRTRKETRVLKQRATIKEVFGEDRPASAPPDTCVNEIKIKGEVEDTDEITNSEGAKNQNESESVSVDTKLALKNRLLNKERKRASSLLKTLIDKKVNTELKEEQEDDVMDDDAVIKRDPDCKSETPSVDGDESSNSSKKRSKFRNIRRKCSSGFDYIRKKKRQIKKDNLENDAAVKTKKRILVPKSNPESIQDIQKEIKTWVLNKGIGETHLHRAARLGYTDITVYCLEKMDCPPSPRDNAGYTPLHEACSRGHLDIARLLLAYGANASESAQGGIRPLHEAVENGFVEIVRLLISYGADPMLATYAGLTPLALASDEATVQLLQNHVADIRGEPKKPWFMFGPGSSFDPRDTGYNILDDVPQTDPSSEEEDMEFEVADVLLPNLYILKGEPPNDRWVLLQDLSNMLKIKSRDALLRQICNSASPSSSSSSTPVNHKSVLRELKMSDFLEQAHCCQFLNAGEKVNTRASKIALIKYTDKVKELLNVEKVLITLR